MRRYIFQKNLLQIYRVHFGRGKIEKKKHEYKYSVRQHCVAPSFLAAFNMADLSNRPCSFERERANTSKQVRHSEGFQEKLSFRACLDPQPTPCSQTQPPQKKSMKQRRAEKLELMDMKAEWLNRRCESHRSHILPGHFKSSCPYG